MVSEDYRAPTTRLEAALKPYLTKEESLGVTGRGEATSTRARSQVVLRNSKTFVSSPYPNNMGTVNQQLLLEAKED